MLYPLNKDCATQPRVTIRDIKVRNVVSTNGVFPPGIIRCNATNPCKGFEFYNVRVTGWFTLANMGFITENVIGKAEYAFPDPGFNQTEEVSERVREAMI